MAFLGGVLTGLIQAGQSVLGIVKQNKADKLAAQQSIINQTTATQSAAQKQSLMIWGALIIGVAVIGGFMFGGFKSRR